jgi:signal transduction histidine kinase
MNLVINGAEAIPAGTPGVLTVTTESRRPTLAEIQRTVIPLANPSEDYVVLSVRDTVSGMDAATVAASSIVSSLRNSQAGDWG